MKIFNRIFAASVAAIAALTACTTEEYVPATPPTGAQVYISADNPSTVTLNRQSESFSLSVLRVDDSADASYVVEVTDTNNVFFSQDVTDVEISFAKGEKESKLVIAVNQDNLVDGESYALDFRIRDEKATTAYGLSAFSMLAVLPEPYVLLGTATLHEDLLTTFFSDVETGKAWECEVYENANVPGMLYFKNAFTSEYPYNEPGDYVTTDKYFMVNVKYPDKVYIPYQGLGMDWGYGEFGVVSLISAYFEGAPDNWGTLKDGVITFPQKGILIQMADYNDGGFYTSNGSGAFVIHLPGAILTDYSVEASYSGMFVDPEGNAEPVIDIAAGDDVAAVNYLIISQDQDVYAALEGIVAEADSVQTVEIVDNAARIQPALEPGLYYMVYCPVDAEGGLQADDADVLDFYFPGASAEKPEVEATLQALDIDKVFPEDILTANGMTNYNSFAYVISGKDIKSVKAYLNRTSVIEGAAADGLTPEMLCAEYGKDNTTAVSAIEANGYYANGYIKLSAETSYTMIVNVENVYGSTACLTATYVTAAMPYSGELVIGDYGDFTLTYAGSENQFIVNNLLLENGSTFRAVYDPSALTLTLDGVEVGYESEGSVFGSLYGYANSEKTQAYAYLVYSAENLNKENADGTDPLVFNVDPASHQVSSYASAVLVGIFSMSDGSFLGAAVQKQIGTTVSLAATSSRKAASCFRLEGIKPADIARPEVSLKAASKAFSKKSLKSSAEKAF